MLMEGICCVREPLNGDATPGQLWAALHICLLLCSPPSPTTRCPGILAPVHLRPLTGHIGRRLVREEGKRGQGADSSLSLEGCYRFVPPVGSPLCTAPVLSSCGFSNCSLKSTFQTLGANIPFPLGDSTVPLYFPYTLLLSLQVIPFLNPLKLPTSEYVICFLLGPLLIRQLIKLLNIVISVEDGAQYLRTVEN